MINGAPLKIGLVGPSYQAWSLPFDAQRLVNLFAVYDKDGKEVSALYGTPGLTTFTTAGAGPHRGAFISQNGRAFFVSGSNLYEVDSAGTVTNRGALLQSSGNITMAENPTQLAICDGSSVYIFTYGSNNFAKVTDVDLPAAGTITFIDGYFVVNKVGTGSFYISDINDGTSWQALEFATAESSPDSLKRVINALGQLWLLGSLTTEIYTNTGASDFPFQRVSGGKLNYGILAPYTAMEIGSSLIFLGRDQYGGAGVYQTSSVSPNKISTEAIDILLQDTNNVEDIVAYAYQQHGHLFYILTGGGLEASLVYDITTGLWHERAWTNLEGEFEQHRGICCIYAFNKFLLGDRKDGRIYEMDMDIYSDDDQDIVRERIYTHLFDRENRIRYNTLDIGFEVGVGLQNGQGSNPLVSLQLSKDGAKTWSTSYTASIGRVGAYTTKVSFRRLGVAEQMTFRIRISDRIKVAITGSYIR